MLLSIFIISVIMNLIFIQIYRSNSFQEKNQIQNIHSHKVSRYGGFTFIISMFLISIMFKNILFLKYLLISLIIILPASLEDLNFEIHPKIRLIFILICSLTLIVNFEKLPLFNFGYLNLIFNNNFFQIIFFTLCLSIVTNGQNMIDGANGLSAFSSATTFACIFFISNIYDDEFLRLISLSLLLLIFSFLIFNFPYGKIFMGDTGSYFLGMTGGFLVIYAFGKYDEMPTWSAAVILFYPTIEVIFSYFRKTMNGKSPLLPDKKHLHLLIFQIIKPNSSKDLYRNSIVSAFMSIIWLSPLAIFPFSLINLDISFISLMVLSFIYLFMYYVVNSIYKSNK